jgi:hypothetical protein
MNDSTIILLDIDDCILPSRQTHAGLVNDHESIFLININRLRMICKTTSKVKYIRFKLFI